MIQRWSSSPGYPVAMTDVNATPLDAFPTRSEGEDELRLDIRALRPAEGNPSPSGSGNLGLDVLATGLPGQILAALEAVGCPRDRVFVKATMVDEGDSPIIALADVVPLPAADPTPEAPAEG